MSKRKYIKAGRINLFPTIVDAIRTRDGIFINNKFYSSKFLVHWPLRTFILKFKHEEFHGYYKIESKAAQSTLK